MAELLGRFLDTIGLLLTNNALVVIFIVVLAMLFFRVARKLVWEGSIEAEYQSPHQVMREAQQARMENAIFSAELVGTLIFLAVALLKRADAWDGVAAGIMRLISFILESPPSG
jgi:hypothetical protein